MFSDVSISLPAKERHPHVTSAAFLWQVRGPEAEEEWTEVDWVTWSTGSVSVEPEWGSQGLHLL